MVRKDTRCWAEGQTMCMMSPMLRPVRCLSVVLLLFCCCFSFFCFMLFVVCVLLFRVFICCVQRILGHGHTQKSTWFCRLNMEWTDNHHKHHNTNPRAWPSHSRETAWKSMKTPSFISFSFEFWLVYCPNTHTTHESDCGLDAIVVYSWVVVLSFLSLYLYLYLCLRITLLFTLVHFEFDLRNPQWPRQKKFWSCLFFERFWRQIQFSRLVSILHAQIMSVYLCFIVCVAVFRFCLSFSALCSWFCNLTA